jgi:membrane protease YdiL (CAAX protease family)
LQKKRTPYIRQGWLRALLFFIFLVNALSVIYFFVFQQPADPDEELFPLLPAFTMTQGILIMAALLTMVIVFAFCKLIDRAPFSQLGLQRDARGALTGFFLAAALLGMGSMILFITDNLQWVNSNINWRELLVTLVLMSAIAFSEELAFRGYILGNLLKSFSRWPAILLSAAGFVVMHAANPGMHTMAIINLLLGGILLGQCFMINRNCWMPVFFHLGWNFLQGPVLGFKVSGLALSSVLEQQLSENKWMTGGDFGFEGSLIATGMLVTGVIVLEIHYMKRSS